MVCRRDCQILSDNGARLIVELQDTSLADAPAKVIARTVGKVVRFPRPFAVKYLSSQISEGYSYSVSVTIRNKSKLLFTNDVHIGVVPVGTNRTRFVTVPVVRVQGTYAQKKVLLIKSLSYQRNLHICYEKVLRNAQLLLF